MSTGAVVVAAGSGTRLGAAVPKALVPLVGVPLVGHATYRLAASGLVDEVVITAPAGHVGQVLAAARDALDRLGAADSVKLRVIDGPFPTRQSSVAAGLDALGHEHDTILVHDAARPLAPPGLIASLIHAVRAGHDAVVPGVPVTDTIRRVAPEQMVIDRSQLRAVQTPQAFRADVLRAAHRAGADRAAKEATAATDDAGLVEDAGSRVHVIDGDRAAMKITDPLDLAIAELLLTASKEHL